jgi:hypothetical protein
MVFIEFSLRTESISLTSEGNSSIKTGLNVEVNFKLGSKTTKLEYKIIQHYSNLLPTFPEYLDSPPLFSGIRVSIFSCLCSVLYIIVRLLSFGHCIVCLLWFTVSEYPFGIFKLFLENHSKETNTAITHIIP